jgi:hypothetical protein
MTNWRGQVAHPDTVLALREHRERIRQLEANPPGSGPLSGLIVLGANLNHWGGNLALQALPNNWVAMSGNFLWDGTLAGSRLGEGQPALNIPSAYRPAHDLSFVAGVGLDQGTLISIPPNLPGSEPVGAGGSGHVIVRANGDVIPFISPLGMGAGMEFVADDFSTGVPNALLDSNDWADAGGPPGALAYVGGGVGIPPATPSTGDPHTAVYLASGPYADGWCSAGMSGNTTTLALGCHIQPQAPIFCNYPPGLWLRVDSGHFRIYAVSKRLDDTGPHLLVDDPSFLPPIGQIQRVWFGVANNTFVVWFIVNSVGIEARDYNYSMFDDETQAALREMSSGLFGLGVDGVSFENLADDFIITQPGFSNNWSAGIGTPPIHGFSEVCSFVVHYKTD